MLEYDDIETYASKGLLEDLNLYIEENGQLEFSDNAMASYTFAGSSVPFSARCRSGRWRGTPTIYGKTGRSLCMADSPSGHSPGLCA